MIPLGVANATLNSDLFDQPETIAQACQELTRHLRYVIELNEGLVWMFLLATGGIVIFVLLTDFVKNKKGKMEEN